MNEWKYSVNQFVIETADSYRKAFVLSTYHDARLAAQLLNYPLLQGCYDRYRPLHLNLVAEYGKWLSQQRAQTKDTASVTDLLSTAKNKLTTVWDISIRSVHVNTSKEYKAIFPNGLKPFNAYRVDLKIQAYENLASSIAKEPNLSHLKNEIMAMHAQLVNARKVQGGSIGATQFSSEAVDTARVAAMNMQYRNMAFVMDTYFDERKTLLPLFFDLKTLREKSQTVYNVTLAAHKTKAVLEHTFMETDKINVHLKSNGGIKFYLALSETSFDGTAVEVQANEKKDIAVTDFGVTDYSARRTLVAVNIAHETTKFKIELL